MKPVKVDKDKLIETLLGNKETHRQDFEIAWEAFRSRAMDNMEAKLHALKNADRGTRVDIWVNLDPPQDHTDDYERVIEMLKWELEDHILLEERDFRAYVQDEWNWTAGFQASAVQYTGSSSPSSGTVH